MTRENSWLRITFTLFQLVSRGNFRHFRHLIIVPWTFPKAIPLGIYLVTATMFPNFKIQSKYNSGLPSSEGMSSVIPFAWYLWEWWMACNAYVVSFCVCCWQCSNFVIKVFIAIILFSNWSCCCVCHSCLCLLSDLHDKELSEPARYESSAGPPSPPPGAPWGRPHPLQDQWG